MLRANAQLTGFILAGSSKALCMSIYMYIKENIFYLKW